MWSEMVRLVQRQTLLRGRLPGMCMGLAFTALSAEIPGRHFQCVSFVTLTQHPRSRMVFMKLNVKSSTSLWD